MNDERAFKLDFFLALAAVLLSVVTTIALIYQTSVMRDQYAATVWPYLSVDSQYDQNGVILSVVNDGFGPALVKSALLTVDGKKAQSWDDYIKTLFEDPLLKPRLHRRHHVPMALTTTSVDGSTIVRPSQQLQLFKIILADSHPAIIKHDITLDFCYCSLNGSCWKFHATPGKSQVVSPQVIPECVVGDKIDSPVKVFRLPD